MRRVLVVLTGAVLYASAAIGQRAPPEVPVNSVLPWLEQDKPIFGHMVNYMGIGSDRQSAIAHSQERETDFVIYDLEHSAFDIPALGDYMQWLLDRGTIARSGTITPSKSVFVRVPVNAREMNQWVIKNVLDQGIHGLVFPLTETVEQVIGAVRAMRYPQKPETPDFDPDGVRGASPSVAARSWGLPGAEYMQRADIWKLDPVGSMLPIFIIENKLGVANVRDIARTLKEKRIGAVLWAGRGDLGVSYSGDQEAVARALDAILAAGKEFGIPVALNMPEDVPRRFQQGARMFVGIGATYRSPPAEVRQSVGR